MATDAPAKFQKPELIPVPHHHTEHHPETSAAAVSAHDGLLFWQFMIGGSIAGMAVHMAMSMSASILASTSSISFYKSAFWWFSLQVVGSKLIVSFLKSFKSF
ncbi:Mitochondrial substrate carrier family protein [Striga hermonthica]|uniref:Mitochondrial substrate carrier family protein n=1 Tax=Striga hermonthica TaxID=68872 RepID=A0A9N7MW30_STRHE|nr:Mitochondrial substrate carrier family protein [Striga hermonthica]